MDTVLQIFSIAACVLCVCVPPDSKLTSFCDGQALRRGRQDSGQQRRLSDECDLIMGRWEITYLIVQSVQPVSTVQFGRCDLKLPVEPLAPGFVAGIFHQSFQGSFTQDGQGSKLRFLPSFSMRVRVCVCVREFLLVCCRSRCWCCVVFVGVRQSCSLSGLAAPCSLQRSYGLPTLHPTIDFPNQGSHFKLYWLPS